MRWPPPLDGAAPAATARGAPGGPPRRLPPYTLPAPVRHPRLERNLTKDQRDIVEKIGLGSLLNIPSMPIQRMLVENLIEKFNVVDRTFTIQGHVISISPWDVWFLEHFQAVGDGLDYAMHQHPLIRNWNGDKVLKQVCIQDLKKFGAEMVEQEDVNREDLHAAMEDDEIKIKESMESMKSLFVRFPELHTVVQMVVKLFDGTRSNRSTKCEGKQCDSSGTRKSRESNSNVEKEREWGSHANNMDKTEKEKPCPEQGTAWLPIGFGFHLFNQCRTQNQGKSASPRTQPQSRRGYLKQKQIVQLLRCGIHSILQAILASSDKLESRWSNYDILNWCSCGIFTIKYMKHWNRSEIANPFMQKDMETFRKKMPAELIMSALNELKSTKEHVLATQN
ncbi:hypothetical protein C2845_PM01G46700 [Panicum miliaceum]|uniref:Uncharacterized protein n=1 Tax=Panicum miliaceum TaxID=4540 RepID=A0A3L6TVB8_PANMI|nr:hypothetical protein C2845_PM01G46700 [Panicum miliaceum]